MRWKWWLAVIGLIAFGGVLGAAALIASIEINHHTSTDAFCGTTCHSMTHLVADPYYAKSRHRTSSSGVLPSCGDCHIPKTNWFVETYAHVAGGVRDIIAENRNNFADPAIWERRRVELAHEVREEMRHNDSATCRDCHAASAIKPESQRGGAAHAMLADGRATCIDCHYNLVHAPVPPSADFLRGSGLRASTK